MVQVDEQAANRITPNPRDNIRDACSLDRDPQNLRGFLNLRKEDQILNQSQNHAFALLSENQSGSRQFNLTALRRKAVCKSIRCHAGYGMLKKEQQPAQGFEVKIKEPA